MHRIKLVGTRKIMQMDEIIRSMRPFSYDSSMAQSLMKSFGDHLKPLCNVLYHNGEYYVYQGQTLMNEPGLTTELSKKTKVDRYFVTNQIKSIVGKASIVVGDNKIPEL